MERGSAGVTGKGGAFFCRDLRGHGCAAAVQGRGGGVGRIWPSPGAWQHAAMRIMGRRRGPAHLPASGTLPYELKPPPASRRGVWSGDGGPCTSPEPQVLALTAAPGEQAPLGQA